MIGFRDMTYCPYYTECINGFTCERALTPVIKAAASKWWGGKDAPIVIYADKPKCFKQWVKE